MNEITDNSADEIKGTITLTQEYTFHEIIHEESAGFSTEVLNNLSDDDVPQSHTVDSMEFSYPDDFKVSPPHDKPSYSYSSISVVDDGNLLEGNGLEASGKCTTNSEGEGQGDDGDFQIDKDGYIVVEHNDKIVDEVKRGDLLVMDPKLSDQISQGNSLFYSQISNESRYTSPRKVRVHSPGNKNNLTQSRSKQISNSTRVMKVKYDLSYFLKYKAAKNSIKKPSKVSSHVVLNTPKARRNMKKKIIMSTEVTAPSVSTIDSENEVFEEITNNERPGIPDVDILINAMNDVKNMEIEERDEVNMDDNGKTNILETVTNESNGLQNKIKRVNINTLPIHPEDFHPRVKDVDEDELSISGDSDDLSDGPDAEEEKIVIENYMKSSFWVRRIFGKRFADYLAATGKLVGNKNIIYLNSEDRSRIEITLKHPDLTDIVIKNGLSIDGVWAKAYRLSEKPIDLLLCDIPAYVPNSALVKPLLKYGKIEAGDIIILRTPNENSDWNHVVGFRRKALLRANKDAKIPDTIKIKYGYKIHKINIISGASKCFGCGRQGHMLRNCRAKRVTLPPPIASTPARDIPLQEEGFSSNRNITVRPQRNDTWADVAKVGALNELSKRDKLVDVRAARVDSTKPEIKMKFNVSEVNQSIRGRVEGDANKVGFVKLKNPKPNLLINTSVSTSDKKAIEDKIDYVKEENSKLVFELMSHYIDAKNARERIGSYPYHYLFSIDTEEAARVISEEHEFFQKENLLDGINDFIAVAVETQTRDEEQESKAAKRPASSSDDLSIPAKANDFPLTQRKTNKIQKRK